MRRSQAPGPSIRGRLRLPAPELPLSIVVLLMGYVPVLYAGGQPVAGLYWAHGGAYYISYFDYLRSSYLILYMVSLYSMVLSLADVVVAVPSDALLLADVATAFSAYRLASTMSSIPHTLSLVTYTPMAAITIDVQAKETLLGCFIYCNGVSALLIVSVVLVVYRAVDMIGRLRSLFP